MSKILGAILGGGSKTPKVSDQPVTDTTNARTAVDSQRSALYATAGGSTGAELDPNQVSNKRNTIFGN